MDELVTFGEGVDANFSLTESASCIVYVHGYGANKDQYKELFLNVFHPKYSYLRFSFRDTNNEDFMLSDLKSAIGFVEQYSTKIGVIGVSLGGVIVTQLSDERVKAMCVASSPVDPNIDINIPFLLVHGNNDVVVPISYAYDLYNNNEGIADIYIHDGNHDVWPSSVGTVMFDWFNKLWENKNAILY